MGYYADQIINGECCDLCMTPFLDKETDTIYEHGYPATCNDCWKELSREDKSMRSRQDKKASTL